MFALSRRCKLSFDLNGNLSAIVTDALLRQIQFQQITEGKVRKFIAYHNIIANVETKFPLVREFQMQAFPTTVQSVIRSIRTSDL